MRCCTGHFTEKTFFRTGFPSASRDMHQQWGLQDNKEVTAESTNHTVQSSNVALLVKVALAALSHVQPRLYKQ